MPDGRIQVFYDFVSEKQLQDWRASTMPQKAVPEDSWVAPTRWDVPIAESYHMKVTRHNRMLRWEIDGQTIAETELADDEFCLTERLMFCNPGKGTGAVFRNVVIRSRILELMLTGLPEMEGHGTRLKLLSYSFKKAKIRGTERRHYVGGANTS